MQRENRKSKLLPSGDCVIGAGDCVFGFLLSSFPFSFFFFFFFREFCPGSNVTFTPLAAFADADPPRVYPHYKYMYIVLQGLLCSVYSLSFLNT